MFETIYFITNSDDVLQNAKLIYYCSFQWQYECYLVCFWIIIIIIIIIVVVIVIITIIIIIITIII